MFNALALVCIGAAFLLITYLLSVIREEQRRTRKRVYRPKSSPRKTQPVRFRPPRPPAPLDNRLVELVNGDSNTAQRLINQVRSDNPHRPPSWCLEKAIYDLERDRR